MPAGQDGRSYHCSLLIAATSPTHTCSNTRCTSQPIPARAKKSFQAPLSILSDQSRRPAPPQIPEGYCQITCGRCDCCPSLLNATLAAGLTEFAWAMNLSSAANRTEDLSQPGLMATLLAPDNNAMLSLFQRLGGWRGAAAHVFVAP